MSEIDKIQPQEEGPDVPRKPRLHERLFDGIRRASKTIHTKAIGAINKVKARKLREFPFKVEDVPEGKAGIDWILEHKEEVLPFVKREIQFDNGGAPSPSRFYTEAAVQHSRLVSEAGYEHWESTGKKIQSAREQVAELIKCDATEVAFEENTVEGIRNIVEKFDWKPGDKIVVLKKDKEYPSNFNPWEDLKRFGVDLIEVGDEKGIVTAEEIAAVLSENPAIRMVALSTVGWKTGQRIDLEKIGEAIAQRNAGNPEKPKTRFFVDAIQSLGQHEVDVKKSNIDYLASGGSKWMLAGSGRGVFYCSRDGLANIRKAGFGASSQRSSHTPGSELKEDATVFEEGMKNFDGSIGLGEAVKLVNRIGIKNIEARIANLTDYLCEQLAGIGYIVTSPRDEKSKSGLVLFQHKTRNSKEINKKLQLTENEQKPIWMSIRDGKMRACIHYYNTKEEIDELISRLSQEELRQTAKDRGFLYGCTEPEIEQAIQSTIEYCKKHKSGNPDDIFQQMLIPIAKKKSGEIYKKLSEDEQRIFDDFLTDSPGRAFVQKLRKLKYAEKIRQKIGESWDKLEDKTLLYMGSGDDLGLAMLTGVQSILMVDPMLDEEKIKDLVAKVKKYDSKANYDEGENTLSFKFYGKKFHVKFYSETLEQFNEKGAVKADIAITHSGQPYFDEEEVRKSLKEKSLLFEVQQMDAVNKETG